MPGKTFWPNRAVLKCVYPKYESAEKNEPTKLDPLCTPVKAVESVDTKARGVTSVSCNPAGMVKVSQSWVSVAPTVPATVLTPEAKVKAVGAAWLFDKSPCTDSSQKTAA